MSVPAGAVDIHSHFFPQPFLRLVRARGAPHGASVERRGSWDWLVMPEHPPIPLQPPFVDAEARRAALARMELTAQALSLSPPMVYWAPPDVGTALAQAFNDGIADLCQAFPDQFVGLATLPLQDVRASLAEMERAVRGLRMRGIYVATAVRGRYLDEPEFWPMWELAYALGTPVFIHPQTTLGTGVLSRHHLFNSVGFPVETAVCAARLIYSGLFDRYPSLRVVLAHGGGALPLLIGRMIHAHGQRRECQEAIPSSPAAYLRHLYFDTITHSDRALQFLVEVVGPDRVLLGSDAPYDMADVAPVGRVRRLGLAVTAQSSILQDTARRLLRLEVQPVAKEEA